MMNDIFSNIQNVMWRSLFADVGALGKCRRNFQYCEEDAGGNKKEE